MLPFEIIEIIYRLSDIDTKNKLRSIYLLGSMLRPNKISICSKTFVKMMQRAKYKIIYNNVIYHLTT